MSLPEIHLRAAARTIDQMPATDLQRAFRELKERRDARTQMEVLQQQTELASLDLDEAAYELASEAEAQNDLARAAHWYGAAALNDFADASLRLAKIFDALAEEHLNARDGAPGTREELDLFSEACTWYGNAIAAGETEADELLEKLIERHFSRSRRNGARAGSVGPQARQRAAEQPGSPSGPGGMTGLDGAQITERRQEPTTDQQAPCRADLGR
jgi:TPR repeat protein